MISQAKIAKELGVSQALVSQVLNGRKNFCSKETYRRIWQHALNRAYSGRGMMFREAPVGLRALATASAYGKKRKTG